MFGFFKKRRRAKLLAQPFPDTWLKIIERNVPYYALLSEDEKIELQDHIRIFLGEKEFEGCGGLTMTDEIRLTIASQACILLLHRETDYFPSLLSILVYPYEYFAETTHHNPDGTVTEDVQARLGESWRRGEVVLSWDDVMQGARNIRDGLNVVFHEFAHQIDCEDGTCNGAPPLPDATLYKPWAEIMTREYEALLDAVEHRHKTLIDHYGATNPAEFFAVITETYFEMPIKLRKRHPELYAMLDAFYKQDPAARYEKALRHHNA